MDMISITNGCYDRDGFSLHIDFAVQRNTLTAVIGPSGAGKSTLMNIISGFDHLTNGAVVLNGVGHEKLLPPERPVSMVFQDNNSFAHMSARDNVGIGIAPNLNLSLGDWQRVDAALDVVGISHLSARKPGDMSGGERQRIALARVLVRNKPILLLDEAFAALGPALRKDMLLLVKRLQTERELTVLMVTHDPADAMLIADQIIFVGGGEVLKPQTTATFFTSKNGAVNDYLGNASPT